MKKNLLCIVALLSTQQLISQNLIVNGDAESMPRGAGWTVVSQGAIACLLAPTNNMVNWTMKPNGTANYPFDHTVGASGGTVFFSGCDTYFTGPFETKQDIDLSADAALIDAGSQLYDFSGYIQTPVSPQTDNGRFIVEYKNAANVVLYAYNSGWQSNFGGSGDGWVHYTNNQLAPVGTRKVTIRLQSELYINQPAINAYFDDVSFSKTAVVPLGLLSFEGRPNKNVVDLNWQLSGAVIFKQFEVERSNDAIHPIAIGFSSLATINATQKNSYQFTDNNINVFDNKYFYRLKMKGIDGKITYSHVVMVKATGGITTNLSPNPASNMLTISGLQQPGTVSVINSNGSIVLAVTVKNITASLNVSHLPNGVYVVKYGNEKGSINKKLLIMHQ